MMNNELKEIFKKTVINYTKANQHLHLYQVKSNLIKEYSNIFNKDDLINILSEMEDDIIKELYPEPNRAIKKSLADFLLDRAVENNMLKNEEIKDSILTVFETMLSKNKAKKMDLDTPKHDINDMLITLATGL